MLRLKRGYIEAMVKGSYGSNGESERIIFLVLGNNVPSRLKGYTLTPTHYVGKDLYEGLYLVYILLLRVSIFIALKSWFANMSTFFFFSSGNRSG